MQAVVCRPGRSDAPFEGTDWMVIEEAPLGITD